MRCGTSREGRLGKWARYELVSGGVNKRPSRGDVSRRRQSRIARFAARPRFVVARQRQLSPRIPGELLRVVADRLVHALSLDSIQACHIRVDDDRLPVREGPSENLPWELKLLLARKQRVKCCERIGFALRDEIALRRGVLSRYA